MILGDESMVFLPGFVPGKPKKSVCLSPDIQSFVCKHRYNSYRIFFFGFLSFFLKPGRGKKQGSDTFYGLLAGGLGKSGRLGVCGGNPVSVSPF